MADENVGDSGLDVEASDGHGDMSSSDEYDPTQAVQTEFFLPSAQNSFVQPSSLESTVHNTSPSDPAALIKTLGSTNPSYNNPPALDHQSLSRSMSRASSQSSDGVEISTKSHEQVNGNVNHIIEAGDDIKPTVGIDRSLKNSSSIDPVSDSTLIVSTNAVPSENVSIQNDMRDQSASEATQNGTTNTVPNLAAIIPDTGASSHSDPTVKPSETLPVPSTTEVKSTAKLAPPTPTTLAPRARLPHDKIGILEDRIKEDPRGNIEAWLALIEEYKKRAKSDDARGIYDRFLAVFPCAVCPGLQ